jgi:hypothetical protein
VSDYTIRGRLVTAPEFDTTVGVVDGKEVKMQYFTFRIEPSDMKGKEKNPVFQRGEHLNADTHANLNLEAEYDFTLGMDTRFRSLNRAEQILVLRKMMVADPSKKPPPSPSWQVDEGTPPAASTRGPSWNRRSSRGPLAVLGRASENING